MRRNWMPIASCVVSLTALFSYPLFVVEYLMTRDVPWANWLLFAVGLALAGGGIVRAFRERRRFGRTAGAVFGAASVAALTLFIFMTEIWSRELPSSATFSARAGHFSSAIAATGDHPATPSYGVFRNGFPTSRREKSPSWRSAPIRRMRRAITSRKPAGRSRS